MHKTLVIGGSILFLAFVGIFSLTYFSRLQKGVLNREDAISAVILSYPELAEYRTTSLPPSSIEAKQIAGAWYVGFIRSGSGVQGILTARCYHVADAKNIALTGTYSGQSDKIVGSVALETCEPIFVRQSASTSPSTTTPAPVPTPQSPILAYGDVTLKLKQLAIFKNLSIRPLSIEEDSRCPKDVQCIQAGTVRVKVQITSSMGVSTSVLKLGQIFTAEGEVITLTSAMPDKNSKVKIGATDYRLVFNVVPKKTVQTPDTKAKCYIGGCSGQLCTDDPNAISTCMYDTKNACYKSATCGRQANGECGWAQTAELSACLAE